MCGGSCCSYRSFRAFDDDVGTSNFLFTCCAFMIACFMILRTYAAFRLTFALLMLVSKFLTINTLCFWTNGGNVIYPHLGQPPIRVNPLKSSDRKKFYPVYPPPPYSYLLIVDKMSINMPTIDSATRLQLAIEELAKNPGISQLEIARLYGVPQSTLQARLKGRRAAKHYHQAAQRLSVHVEQALIDWIERMTSWGWPPRIQHLARSLLNAKGDKNPLGRHWYQKFLKRHPDFKIKYNRNLDQSRKDAGSPEILRDWFELYATTLVKYGISDEDTYNMDEKGFPMGIADSSMVIIKGTTIPFNVHPGNRDWVSLIECISSRGTVLPAYIIFQGA